MDPQLIDRIYEGSFVPEFWPGVLDELGRLVECSGGSLTIAKANVQFWTASPDTHERAERIAFEPERWFWRGQLVSRLFAARHAGFLTDLDLFNELDLEPIYRDMWRPQGIGWAVGTAIPIPTGGNVILALSRWVERGPVERAFVQKLDELRPHLARSVFLWARLQLERARIASETLAALGLPALASMRKARSLLPTL